MFWEDLPKLEISKAALPVVHTTESIFLRDIARGGKIDTSLCKVYKEELVYVFYGRPGYRPSTSNTATKILDYYPVVLLFDPMAITSIRRMLPFDSGGFQSGRFEAFLHPSMTKEQFEIPAPIDNLEAVIDYFFGSTEAYLRAVGRLGEKPSPTKFELSAFYRMVHETQKSPSDDRRVTCEVQSDKPIALNQGFVHSIIASAVFEDEPYFETRLGEWNCSFKGYDCTLANSNEMHGLISQLVKDALDDWKRDR
ncbi:hypothetical protein HFO38_30480 [Rhizobium leguminosarum]|uniref:hypothetical protein n=1 Tax=Rhizobium leguminosarum TaxID=384 RepID=UPI001C98009D|nr:hypothetical protein [Rhizobium leguminosarum]MBY5706977.1 hypothetical protein [Rhizobium leguminosarum]